MLTWVLNKAVVFGKTTPGRLMLLALILLFIFFESRNRNDLDIFLNASSDLFSGVDIYKALYFDGYHYYYSLFFATIIHPLVYLPDWLGKAIWIAFNVMLLWRIWHITLFFLKERFKSTETIVVFGFLLLIIALRFVRGNLHLCQMTILILYLTLESLHSTWNNRPIRAGLLLALSINFKLLPLVLLPYLIYRNQWKSAVSALIFLALLFVLPALWLGWQHNGELLFSWWSLINPSEQKHILDVDETSFHSISTLLATLFIEKLPDHGALEVRRHILNLSFEQLYLAIQIFRGALVLLTLWFLRSMPFVGFKSKEKTWWEVSYILLIIPLIFPHQQHYAFLFAMPAMAWVLTWLMQKTERPRSRTYAMMLFCFVLIAVVFNLSLWLGVFVAWYNHFKILTYAALLLIPLLALTRPEVQKNDVRLGS